MAKKTFESALARLEELTAELEAGDLPLEKSLAKFSEGVELAGFCKKTLDEARGQVELLSATATGKLSATPFTESENGDETGSDEASRPF